MRSYRPEELFDDDGRPVAELLDARPRRRAPDERQPGRQRRPSAVRPPAARLAGARRGGRSATARRRTRPPGCSGAWLREVTRLNPDNFRVFAPDELASNRLAGRARGDRRATGSCEIEPNDVGLDPSGRVVEVLSEHVCQGLLEGYLLTGRHGVFTCYEAFIHIVDSMFNQHAKWLEASVRVPWRERIPSLNYLLSSHVWRQDHNGSTHQDPGFLDVVMNKKPGVVRVYLPPDANTLLSHLRPLPPVAPVRERGRGRQATAGRLAVGGGGRAALRAGRRHLGLGRHRAGRPRPARRRARLRRRRPHARDARRRVDPARAAARTSRCGSSTSSTSCACCPSPSTPMACPTGSSTRSSPTTRRSSSPSTATRG